MTKTTAAKAPEPTGTKDFSRKRERILFVVDEEEFEAAVALPAEIFVQFTVRFNEYTETEGWKESYEALDAALDLVLLTDSYERLHARFSDKTKPVDLDQMADIIMWLLEQYGLRPTQPSSDSSDGQPSPEPGTSSTENSPAEESTSELSLPIAS